jgi:hypothetical protein
MEYQQQNETQEEGVVDLAQGQVAEVKAGPANFSSFIEKNGYSGRFLSKYRINSSMVTSVFQHQRQYQELKMRGLSARLLKIDFNYKLAMKIRVWTKQGQSFSPYKCLCTVQNQDGLTVFWKAMKHAESFAEIKEDLVRLRERLNHNALSARQLPTKLTK